MMNGMPMAAPANMQPMIPQEMNQVGIDQMQ